jgi:predicted kinase
MFATVHLVVGSTGAGKSTYARRLAADGQAVRFAIDEWMMALFGPDRPDHAGADWYMPRIDRATGMIWRVAREIVAAGTSVVLEVGLTQRAPRQAFLDQVVGAGAPVRLHVLEADAATRWRRVEGRNSERGATFALEVTRGMFDFVETMWEPPDDDELRAHDGVRVDTT